MLKFRIFNTGDAQCFVCVSRQLAVLEVPYDNLVSQP